MDQPLRFGKYSLLDRISSGGMAEVFRARTQDGKLYAVKRILPSLAEDESFIKMFVQEARISGQLVHPNIARIYELGRVDGTHFMAMEYVWGKDLTQIRNRLHKLGRKMPLGIACAMMCQALDGLDYAHKKRDGFSRALDVVHRDCSPHNMLVAYSGDVKIIDFGIAKAKSSIVKTVGVLKGKFAYMSPEQTTGKSIDRRSDIFSTGIVLYEILTSQRLFVGDSDFAVLERVRTADIRPITEAMPDLPADVAKVAMTALAADREKRYQWASDMRADLERVVGVASRGELSAWVCELFADDIANEREDIGLDIQNVGKTVELEPEIEVMIDNSAPLELVDLDEPPPQQADAPHAIGDDVDEVELGAEPLLDMPPDDDEPAPPPPPSRPPPTGFEEDEKTAVKSLELVDPPWLRPR
jgi:serine/threonine protein kinase|nr:serine/threonine-protein kinase [Kofleriaceae bacterium]